MADNTHPQPRNIMEQIAYGLQTVNDNIVDLYRMVEELHNVFQTMPEPNASGTADTSTEEEK
jgi:hypothetical protein